MIEWRVIAKKIAGITNDSEDRLFQTWLAKDDAHDRYYRRAVREFHSPSKIEISEQEFDTMIDRFDRFVTEEAEERAERRARRRQRTWVAVALFVPLLVVSALYIAGPRTKTDPQPVTTPVISVEPGTQKATLILNDGQTVPLDGQGSLTFDAEPGTTIVNDGSILSYNSEATPDERQQESFNTMLIPRGAEYTLELSDGSKVWFNSETKLKYPTKFIGSQRVVELEGEAYFEVSHDKNKPFIVKTATSRVEVFGTAFNVSAYGADALHQITLCNGSVEVGCANRTVKLTPGQQAVVSGGNLTGVRSVDTDLYAGWHLGYFVFEKETLANIMNKLSRWYDLDVQFESQGLRDLHFTGDLKRYDNFEKILSLIQMTCNVKFELKGSVLSVSRR